MHRSLPPPLVAAALLLAACGENGDGNEDTILTGFSGFVIFCLAVWLIVRAFRHRR